jgi:hypothetical protein
MNTLQKAQLISTPGTGKMPTPHPKPTPAARRTGAVPASGQVPPAGSAAAHRLRFRPWTAAGADSGCRRRSRCAPLPIPAARGTAPPPPPRAAAAAARRPALSPQLRPPRPRTGAVPAADSGRAPPPPFPPQHGRRRPARRCRRSRPSTATGAGADSRRTPR